jgi:hypothetical protein
LVAPAVPPEGTTETETVTALPVVLHSAPPAILTPVLAGTV